jgi:hypothetical protein
MRKKAFYVAIFYLPGDRLGTALGSTLFLVYQMMHSLLFLLPQIPAPLKKKPPCISHFQISSLGSAEKESLIRMLVSIPEANTCSFILT